MTGPTTWDGATRNGGPQARGRPPAFLSRFIGRHAEVAELAQLVGERRLVTVSGTGGCGKTRLASEVLGAIAVRWADGAVWVDLESIGDPARVPEVVADSVGLPVDPAAGPLSALIQHLRYRELVMCLDDCEHLLDACARLVEQLLPDSQGLTVITTSRERLGIAGETVWNVPSMADADAIELFADRASQVLTGFTINATNEAAVRDICQRLDGLPLAIELAAAWVRTLTPDQIAPRLDDRFQLLVGGRGPVPRRQALLASVEWSHDLLAEQERILLRRLAVFARGFSAGAAQAVCEGDGLTAASLLPALRRLVDSSLCVAEQRGGATRFRLLETIREYAAPRLDDAGESAIVRDRHVDHFLRTAEAAVAALDLGNQDLILAELEADHDNLRAALERGLSRSDPEPGLRLAAALIRFWLVHGHASEGIRFVERAMSVSPDDESRIHGELLAGLALLAIPGGRLGLVESAARRALDIGTAMGDDRLLARAYVASAYLPFYVDFAGAQDLAKVAQRHGIAAGDVFAVDFAVLVEACALTNTDRHADAVALARPLAERAIARGDRFNAAFARGPEMWAALFTGQVHRAVRLGEDAVEIATPLNDYFTLGTATANLAWAKGLSGAVTDGRRLMERVLRSIEDGGPDVDVVGMSWIAGRLRTWSGEPDAAVAWFQRALRRFDAIPDNWIAALAMPGLADALRRLGRVADAADAAERALQLGSSLGSPHVVAEALEQLAHLAAADDPARAEDLHQRALRVRVDHGLQTFFVDSLDALAGLASARDRKDVAARLVGASDAAREAMGYPRALVDRSGHEALVEALDGGLGEGFQAAWSEGAQLSLDDAVAYAMRSRGPRKRPLHGWAGLTPAERQVVDLAADGLTNAAIAERLFVSPATVKTHLAHAYAKLGVANRAELAALAIRNRNPNG